MTTLNLILWILMYSVCLIHIVVFAVIYSKHKNKIELFYLIVLATMFLLSVVIVLALILKIEYIIPVIVNSILLLYITVPLYGFHLFGVHKQFFKFIPILVVIEAIIENLLLIRSAYLFLYISRIVFYMLFLAPIFINTKKSPKDSLEGVMQNVTRVTVIIFLAFMVVFIPFSRLLFEISYVSSVWWAFFTLSYQIPGLVYCKKYLFNTGTEVKKADLSVLSKRENEIALAICDGLKYEEIAEKLFVSLSTVKFHAHSIYRKLGIKNNRELVHLFMETRKNTLE